MCAKCGDDYGAVACSCAACPDATLDVEAHELIYLIVVTPAYVTRGATRRAPTGCCANYSVANRSKRYVIENLLCVEENLVGEHAEAG